MILEPVQSSGSAPAGPPLPVGPRRRAGWMRRLYLTLRTEHVTPAKLGLRDRVALTRYAIRRGLVEP